MNEEHRLRYNTESKSVEIKTDFLYWGVFRSQLTPTVKASDLGLSPNSSVVYHSWSLIIMDFAFVEFDIKTKTGTKKALEKNDVQQIIRLDNSKPEVQEVENKDSEDKATDDFVNKPKLACNFLWRYTFKDKAELGQNVDDGFKSLFRLFLIEFPQAKPRFRQLNAFLEEVSEGLGDNLLEGIIPSLTANFSKIRNINKYVVPQLNEQLQYRFDVVEYQIY